MELRRATEVDRPGLAALTAGQQMRPERHIAYLGVDADSIAADMIEEDDDWTAVSAIAEAAGSDRSKVVGWMMGSVDPEMGRVWWFGPYVDTGDDQEWGVVADSLFEYALTLLPSSVDQHEMAPDERHRELIDWATGRGFDIDPGSAVLSLAASMAAPTPDDTVAIRPVTADDHEPFAALHDRLFPSTHTTGPTLASDGDDRHLRLVAEHDGGVAGYVAAELQADGGGYIDYLGVDPSQRRRGLGARLVTAAVTELRAIGAGEVNLTVRSDNHGARALYRGLGFAEERVIVPLRRGFRLP